ncbi:MAG: phenylacetate--CoA ligase family protein [Magnetococcales bacterium]|nr:phenylacetate--CoA ligase family protein [Magnetococcales bacterium]
MFTGPPELVPGPIHSFWPPFPRPEGALLLAMQWQFEQGERLAPELLRQRVSRQLAVLVRFAFKEVPYYRERYVREGWRWDRLPRRVEDWSSLPILSREGLLQAGTAMIAGRRPAGHDRGHPMKSSGSTGQPVVVQRNNVKDLVWQAITLREHLWHRRDFSGKMATIRKMDHPDLGRPPHGSLLSNWGAPVAHVFRGGPMAVLDIATASIAQQREWLLRENPDYLLTYPTNAHALAREFIDLGLRLPRLRQVRTLSETLTGETRKLCREAWDVAIVDTYSANEVGYIALQCPDHERYHVQAENVWVEIVDSQGAPCVPGTVGRVIVTDLNNFSSPLLRYDTGDWAIPSDPCPCGRGLPTLERIMGRSRNMLVLPSGERRWPMMRPSLYREILPLKQIQMVQHTPVRLEVRLVVDQPPGPAAEDRLRQAIVQTLGYGFDIEFQYRKELIRSQRGKFEEFVSLVEESAFKPGT